MDAAGSSSLKPLHVAQVGWDRDLLQPDAPSDSRQRQELYAQLLNARRPGSRMTTVVLGAPRSAKPMQLDGVSVEPIIGRWSGVAKLGSVLARLHAERPISVIAPQSPLEEGWASLAFARGQIPVVAQVHFDMLSDNALPGGNPLRRVLGRARRRVAMRLLPSYAAIRTVAPDMAAELVARGARSVRSIPVPILDLETLLAIPAHEPPPRILFVGRLAPEKNLALWLEVARRVSAVMPDLRFDIIGGGEQRSALEARARHLGLGDTVMFHGAKPRAVLPEAYARSSALLLTSDHEGFGRVLVEAMAAGVPVVSTATAGAREVLGDGEVGVLAPIGDAEALAAGVLRLLGDITYRAGLVAAGRRRVAERYRPLVLAGQWVDMLIEASEHHADRPSR